VKHWIIKKDWLLKIWSKFKRIARNVSFFCK